MIGATILLALRSLRRNPLRSFLTTIGIVIGVASVIAMVTLGRGATAKVTNEIASLGNNLLIVVPGAANQRGPSSASRPFTLADARAIDEQIPDALAVAPNAGAAARIVYGARNWSTSVTGATNDWFVVRDWDVAIGRRFHEGEVRSGTAVCVLGETVRRELFGTGDPVGARIRVASVACEVIGVLESRGQSTFGQDQDDFIVMPLFAVQRRMLGSDDIAVIAVSANDGATSRVQSEITALLRQRRHIQHGEEDDFSVRDLREISNMLGVVTGVLTALLGAIAGVSLLVGGIGIMNIMLVSVTERTREIGIRLAIGARSREILSQFLVEAVVLSIVGGVAGIALGLGASALAARGLGLPFVFGPDVVLGSFVFSALVGVFFGWYPARRAARLDPIEALRHE
ncbi:ABC transporter permease [Sandaracinus amylolyticus]|uniref:ABC transporter permease n=1 Tax=Sandaracinus amylolyticus TaxID=927083 RepID=UPI001F37EB41|nr:ABC transporter permease [Sandaracinus amylolyticus]UJR86135.1 Hypothetical protein I5071_82160 [Sandaracinus amylolyticus]